MCIINPLRSNVAIQTTLDFYLLDRMSPVRRQRIISLSTPSLGIFSDVAILCYYFGSKMSIIDKIPWNKICFYLTSYISVHNLYLYKKYIRSIESSIVDKVVKYRGLKWLVNIVIMNKMFYNVWKLKCYC